MNIKWVLVISAVAFCSTIIVSMPDREYSMPHQGERQGSESAQLRQVPTGQRVAVNENASFSSLSSSISGADSQEHVVTGDVEVMDSSGEQQAQPASDAFPDASMLSADQIAEPRQTDESELETERKNIDLYFPVEESLAYEPSEVEMEQQRLEMEQQIAEQADALENPSYIGEQQFDMPPSEY